MSKDGNNETRQVAREEAVERSNMSQRRYLTRHFQPAKHYKKELRVACCLCLCGTVIFNKTDRKKILGAAIK